MFSDDPDRPRALLPEQFNGTPPLPQPLPPTRRETLQGSITLWPKAGSVLSCVAVLAIWLYLIFSDRGSDTGSSVLSHVLAPFGLSVPYAVVVSVACALALLSFGWPLLMILSAQVSFDGEALFFADGILTREQTSWHVSRIETVEVFSPLAGRVLGYGSLRIAATGGSELWVLGLRRPKVFAQAILDAQARDAAFAAGRGRPPIERF